MGLKVEFQKSVNITLYEKIGNYKTAKFEPVKLGTFTLTKALFIH